MPPTNAICPSCGAQVRTTGDAGPSANVKCPECGTVFSAADSGYGSPGGAESLSTNYSLDLSRIFNRGWGGFSQNIGLLVGATLVMALVSIPLAGIVFALNLVPIIGSLLGSFVSAAVLLPMWYGLVVVALAILRGQPAAFGDAFGGFRFWGALFVYGLMVGVLTWVCTLPANICMFVAGAPSITAILQGQPPPPPANPGLFLLGNLLNYAGLAIMIVISVRYFMLAPFLIIDRKFATIDAIKANARLTQGHFLGWLGIGLLFGLLGGAGIVVCCVGILFTIPLYFCLMTAAYLEATSGSRY